MKAILREAAAVGLGVAIVVVTGFVLYVRSLPPLAIWHRVELDEEFTAGAHDDFAAYLAREARLFAELEAEVRGRVATGPAHALNRYSAGSLSDPARWPTDWNRTFEWPTAAPRAGVLLLHGLSDSPYSLRALGEKLAEAQAWVVGLRLPGHGTAPAALTRARWEDMAAAVALAVRHVRDAVGDAPLYLVGYSNGGALAIEYALAARADPACPRADALVLLSPEIGVTPFAALAIWQERLGRLLGIEALAWAEIAPEYDPFKYNSFPTRAGDLAHRLTARIQAQLDALAASGGLDGMPPVLAFQSAVDATVSAPALVEDLFARLPPAGHELVLFDLNRQAGIEPMLARDPGAALLPMLSQGALGFDLTVVTNAGPATREVVARQRHRGRAEPTEVALGAAWPKQVYSLAHVSLPFPPDDPLYGGPEAVPSPGIQLGHVALRGERGVLVVDGGALLRMRWNPFYDYVEERILAFLALGP